MLDHANVRRHHLEFAYLTGRFVVEHLVRMRQAFEGDVLAGLVLGTIAQHNVRRFYEEIVPATGETMDALFARGAHLQHLRPCNAMSVAASTGIPRETVRRKIRWLVQKGWVQQVGRDKLFVTVEACRHFVNFDIDTMDRFHTAAIQVLCTLQERARPSRRDASPPGAARAR
jgi:hypothetical protein